MLVGWVGDLDKLDQRGFGSGPGDLDRRDQRLGLDRRVISTSSISGGFPLVEQAASAASCRVETTVCLGWWAGSVISTSSISGGWLDRRVISTGSISGWGSIGG